MQPESHGEVVTVTGPVRPRTNAARAVGNISSQCRDDGTHLPTLRLWRHRTGAAGRGAQRAAIATPEFAMDEITPPEDSTGGDYRFAAIAYNADRV